MVAASAWALPTVVATDQAQRRLVILEGETNGVARVTWEWSAPNDPGIATNHHDRSWAPDECKPVDGGRTILTTASAGLFAGIDVATCRAKFYGLAEGNPHSIERLPDGRYVVAASDGNALTVVDVGEHPFEPDLQPKTKYTLEYAHGVVWDAKRNCLWAIGAYTIEKLAYDSATMSLKRLAVYDFKAAGYHVGHDLILRNDKLEFTVHEGLVAFDPETAAFAPVDVVTRNVKSVAYADGGRLTSVPQVKWWTDTLTFRRGDDVRTLRLPKAKFYKARFLVRTGVSS